VISEQPPGFWARTRFVFVSALILSVVLAPCFTGDLKPDLGVETRVRGAGWVISSVARGSLADQAGLRAGDVVLALDGNAPNSRRLTSPSLDVQDIHHWLVERAGEEVLANIDLAAAPLVTRIEPVAMLALALVFWGSAVFVGLAKPSDSLSLRYRRLSFASAVVLALAPAATRNNLWAWPVEVLAFASVPAFFFHFCATLASMRSVGRGKWTRLLMGAGLAAGLAYLAAGYLGAGWYDVSRDFLLILLAGSVVGGIGMLACGYRRPPSLHTRQQMQIVFLGVGLGMLPLIVLSVLPEVFGQPAMVHPQLAGLAQVALPVAVTYAIVRHRLLEIEVVVSRTLVYALMALLLAGCYAIALELVNLVTLGHGDALPPALVVLFFAAITSTFSPVHDRLRRSIDRMVYGDRYDHVHLMHELAVQLASFRPIHEVLPKITERIMRAMNLEGAAVLLEQPDHSLALRAASGTYAAPQGAADLLRRTTEWAARRDRVPCGAVEQWLPLASHEREVGLLYLGPKRNRLPLGHNDLSVAQTIASHTGSMLAIELLVEQLRAKVTELELLRDQLLHAEESERKRLAQHLHDGALHTVLDLVRQAEGLLEHSPQSLGKNAAFVRQLTVMAERGRDAAYELRATCSDLYPSELAHLGLVAALEGLADATRRDEDLDIELVCDGYPIDYRLGQEAEDALYRAARESLGNVVRHARARRATIKLARDGSNMIALSVRDDGQGMAMPLSTTALLRSGHFGLATIRERAERHRGSLEVRSGVGEGTTIRVRIRDDSTSGNLGAGVP